MRLPVVVYRRRFFMRAMMHNKAGWGGRCREVPGRTARPWMRLPWRFGNALACGLFLAAGALRSDAQPLMPEPAGEAAARTRPLSGIGRVAWGDAYATGWLASPRVAVTAAHAYGFEGAWGLQPNQAGLNLPEPRDNGRGSRSTRVLTGYVNTFPATAAPTEQLNRDTAVLLFAYSLSDAVLPFAENRFTGTFGARAAGYPGTLRYLQPHEALHHHADTLSATFARHGPVNDANGRPNHLVISPALGALSGMSGGPLLREIDGVTTAVGVLVARRTADNAAIFRGIDPEAGAMIRQAQEDTNDTGLGSEVWMVPFPKVSHLEPGPDGSIGVVGGHHVGVITSDGVLRWRHSIDDQSEPIVFNGRGLLLRNSRSGVFAHDAATGAVLWSLPGHAGVAIDAAGDVFVRKLSAPGVFPQPLYEPGNVVGRVRASDGVLTPLHRTTPALMSVVPLVLTSGLVVEAISGGVEAFDPDTGRTVWSWEGAGIEGLAPRPDGGVVVTTSTSIVLLDNMGGVIGTLLRGSLERVVAVFADNSWVTTENDHTARWRDARGGVLAEWAIPGAVAFADAGRALHVREYTQRLWTRSVSGESREVSLPGMGDATGMRFVPTVPGRVVCMSRAGVHAVRATVDDSGSVWNVVGQYYRRRLPWASRTVHPPDSVSITREGVGFATGIRLSVSALGSRPFRYAWYRNGELVADALGAILVVPETPENADAEWSVVVSNEAGAASSPAVRVGWDRPPVGTVLISMPHLSFDLKPAVTPAGELVIGSSSELSVRRVDGTLRWSRWIPSTTVRSTLVDDEGGIWVLHSGGVHAYSADGVLLHATSMSHFSGSGPWMAAPRAGGVVAGADRTLVRIAADGTVPWRLALAAAVEGILILADDTIVVSTASDLVCIAPTGTVRTTRLWTGPGPLLGVNSQGHIVAANGVFSRDGMLVEPVDGDRATGTLVVLEDGRTLSVGNPPAMPWALRALVRMPGTSSVESFEIPTSSRLIAATDDGGWILSTTQGCAYVDRHGAQQAQVIQNPYMHHVADHAVLLPTGVLIGGRPMQAVVTAWRPAASSWPSEAGDVRNTRRASAGRAPTAGVATEIGPVVAGVHPDGLRRRLASGVLATGGVDYQWLRDGVELPGAVQAVLDVESADHGLYRVRVTDANGARLSEPLQVDPVALPPIPTGAWGLFQRMDPFMYGVVNSLVLSTGPGRARVFEAGDILDVVVLPSGALRHFSGLAVPISWGPDGWRHQSAARIETGGAAVLPNGLHTGVYLGAVPSSPARTGAAVVLADGRILGFFPYYDTNHGIVRFSDQWQFTGAETIQTSSGLTLEVVGPRRMEVRGGPFELMALRQVAAPGVSRIANLSTRGWVSPETGPMIAGFVSDVPNAPVVVRAVGPALTGFGLGEALRTPRLAVFDAAGRELLANQGWHAGPVEILRTAFAQVGAFPLDEASDDAAAMVQGGSRVRTAVVDGRGAGGVALVEVYKLAAAGEEGWGALRNVATLGWAGQGERALVAGFVVEGDRPRELLLRVVSVGLRQFLGVQARVASQPVIQLHRVVPGQPSAPLVLPPLRVSKRDVALFGESVGAFPTLTISPRDQLSWMALPEADMAWIVVLDPGGYTITASAPSLDREGPVLVEVYDLPQ